MTVVRDTEAGRRQALFTLLHDVRAVHVVRLAVDLGIADTIGDHPRALDEIAAAHDIAPQRMVRLLRAFVSLGLGTEPSPGVFALTDLGGVLRAGVAGAPRDFVEMLGGPMTLGAWAQLETSIRTGRAGYEAAFGESVFTAVAADPDLSERYNRMMSQMSAAIAESVAEHYDFGRSGTVTDVGGGNGTLLAAILRRHPGLSGVLFDSVTGTTQAPAVLRAAGVAARCSITTGDFFDTVPAGSDLYLLKAIVHDWDDERAVAILRTCRAALPAHGRLLIIEQVLPDTAEPGLPGEPYLHDLHMLVIYGGAERTRSAFERLCAAADLTVTAVLTLPDQPGTAVIETAPA